MMNLGRLSAFLEAMGQFEIVIKIFLNTSELVAFVWVCRPSPPPVVRPLTNNNLY
jgi:hypothetical protein